MEEKEFAEKLDIKVFGQLKLFMVRVNELKDEHKKKMEE